MNGTTMEDSALVNLPRQPERSKFKLRFNSLWTIWFCVLIVCVELYLVVESIGSYTVYNAMDWPNGKPTNAINATLAFAVLCLLCLPAFVVACVAKVGNLANDEAKLGTDAMKEIWHKRQGLSTMARIWRDFGPTAQVVHIIAAFFLLLPRPFIEAELIRAEFLSRADTWWSDLSVLFPLTERQLPNNTIERSMTQAGFISMEFINFALAFFMFMVRYAAVFWHTNLPFSCLFSIQLFFFMLQSVVSFCAFSVVYKAQVNYQLLPDISFILPASGTVVLYILSSILVFGQNIAVFEYGYHQYVVSRRRTRKKVWPNYQKETNAKPRSDCYGYSPHIVAMVSMLLSAILKAPFLYDGGVIYRWYNDKLILWCIVGEVCYLMFWIVLWFGLTVKQKWYFRFSLPVWYKEKSELFTIRNEAFRDSASDLTLDVVSSTRDSRRLTYDDRSDPSGSTVISNERVVRADVNSQIYQPSRLMADRMAMVRAERPSERPPERPRDQHSLVHRPHSTGDSRDYQHRTANDRPPSQYQDLMPLVATPSAQRRNSISGGVTSTSVIRDPGMVATVNIKITPNLVPESHQHRSPGVTNKPGSVRSTPSHSTPCTPVTSRPTTPTRSITPKPRRGDTLNRSDRKKRNRVTFEDCIRNSNHYSDSDEPKSDDENDRDSTNSSNSSHEPKPVGILKKPIAPKSPSAKDIAKAIEGIQIAAKEMNHSRQTAPTIKQSGPPGALQPQIRSKTQRRDSKSSDMSSESPDKDYITYGSLPRNYKLSSPEAQRVGMPELMNSRGQPVYSSTGRGILKTQSDFVPNSRNSLPLLDTQLDSGVELSDSSSMAYGPASPQFMLNASENRSQRDSANYSMSSQDSTPNDPTKDPSGLCSQV